MIMQRRAFLTGLGSLLAAPAVVHASVLMPVSNIDHLLYPIRGLVAYAIQTDELLVRIDRANFKLHIPPVGRGVEHILNDGEIRRLFSKEQLAELIPKGDKRNGMSLTIPYSPQEWREKGVAPIVFPLPYNLDHDTKYIGM